MQIQQFLQEDFYPLKYRKQRYELVDEPKNQSKTFT